MMKNTKKGFSAIAGSFAGRLFPALAVLVLIFGACNTEADDDTGGPRFRTPPLPIGASAATAEPHYYSLKTGKEVSGDDVNTTAWDIAIKAHNQLFFILTNSGVSASAENTGGDGGVWYTDKTDFDSVSGKEYPQQDTKYESYNKDVRCYITPPMGPPSPFQEMLNVITFLNFPSGIGSAEKPFTLRAPGSSDRFSPSLFDNKQAYSIGGVMPPEYTPSKQVYIVRHGDGLVYSKIQVSDIILEGIDNPSTATIILEIRYAAVY